MHPSGLSLQRAQHLPTSPRRRAVGVLSTSRALAFSCQSEWKSLPKLNMLCLEEVFACRGDVLSTPAPACKLMVLLMLLGNVLSNGTPVEEGNASCSLLKCISFRKSSSEMETMGRICWHTDERSLLLQLLAKPHEIRAMHSLFSFTYILQECI